MSGIPICTDCQFCQRVSGGMEQVSEDYECLSEEYRRFSAVTGLEFYPKCIDIRNERRSGACDQFRRRTK